MSRLLLALGLFTYVVLPALLAGCTSPAGPPNIVIIFADDLGYGDLGVYGHPTIHTPNLDRMAAEGMKFTQFYAAASVCTPSRAGLLTGRLPVRSGMAGETRRVLFPDSKLGLPAEEITLAEALKESGYATAAIGKWHLGHLPAYLPTANGFDYYFGIPYSNDMDRVVGGEWQDPFWEPKSEYWNVPLMRDEEIIEQPADQTTITRRYTEEAIQFIQEHRDGPFFVYLAHSMPHVPLFTSDAFAGASRRGLYGDVIEELDWSVGQVLNTLRQEGLAENTLVFFTSDNGPWLVFDTHGGSAGLLRGGKGMTWEGGMREPSLAWWPGTIAPGQVSTALTSTMDYFTTALELAGRDVPADRVIDGRSLLPILRGDTDREIRDTYFFYRGTTLQAVRKGSWKAHYITRWEYEADDQRMEHNPPMLFNLDEDPSEQYDRAALHPEILADLAGEV
ncbi:MAG: sulfatase, partial [Rhodothermales bacterium]|nr:sulfatase [Rhodothermales bacterium]